MEHRFTPRPTTYKGIEMRSRTEAGFAAWLDQHFAGRWEYEPQAFAGRCGQYLPDFVIHDLEISSWGTVKAYVEIKPAATADLKEVYRRTAVIFESDAEAIVVVALEGSETVLWVDAQGVAHSSRWGVFYGPNGVRVGLVQCLPPRLCPWPPGWLQEGTAVQGGPRRITPNDGPRPL